MSNTLFCATLRPCSRGSKDAPPHPPPPPPTHPPRAPLRRQVYGAFYRKMSKRVQSELAEANSVAEEALGTMTTVKAHAGALGAGVRWGVGVCVWGGGGDAF